MKKMTKWIKIRDAIIDGTPCRGAWINMDDISIVNPNDRQLEMTNCSTVTIGSDYDWNKVNEFLRNNEAL